MSQNFTGASSSQDVDELPHLRVARRNPGVVNLPFAAQSKFAGWEIAPERPFAVLRTAGPSSTGAGHWSTHNLVAPSRLVETSINDSRPANQVSAAISSIMHLLRYEHTPAAQTYSWEPLSALHIPASIALSAVYSGHASDAVSKMGLRGGQWLDRIATLISSSSMSQLQILGSLAAVRAAATLRPDPPEISILDDGAVVIEYNDIKRIVSLKLENDVTFLSRVSSGVEVSVVITGSESTPDVVASRFLIELCA